MKSLSSDPLSTVTISGHGIIVSFESLSPEHYTIINFCKFTPRCQRFSPHDFHLRCSVTSLLLLDELVPFAWAEELEAISEFIYAKC
jgi:hypothetical protein